MGLADRRRAVLVVSCCNALLLGSSVAVASPPRSKSACGALVTMGLLVSLQIKVGPFFQGMSFMSRFVEFARWSSF